MFSEVIQMQTGSVKSGIIFINFTIWQCEVYSMEGKQVSNTGNCRDKIDKFNIICQISNKSQL